MTQRACSASRASSGSTPLWGIIGPRRGSGPDRCPGRSAGGGGGSVAVGRPGAVGRPRRPNPGSPAGGSPAVTLVAVPVVVEGVGEHLAVGRAGGQQRVVGALGHHPAAVDQHHAIGEGDRGGAVGDDDGGPVAHDLGEGVADLVLLGRVDRRRGVVEDEHAGVGQDGPGDGDALALATRQGEAPLADLGARTRRAGRR